MHCTDTLLISTAVILQPHPSLVHIQYIVNKKLELTKSYFNSRIRHYTTFTEPD